MTKKILVMLLTLCLAIAAMTIATMAETVSGNGWSLDTETGELIIDDDMGSYYWANTSRSTYASYVVTATIKSGSAVYRSTFDHCTNLTSVSLPSGITSIGDNAFNGCFKLESIDIPSSVISIESMAFYYSGITSVTLSCGTTYAIDSFPTSCTITQAAHTYVNHVCSVCGSLDCIAYGDGWVLANDGTLRFTDTNGIWYWAETDHTAYCEKVTSVVFYDGTDCIPSEAFNGCSNLTSITIPNTVTEIGDYAFYGCSSLTTVTIPSSVEFIGSSAFQGCSGLQSFVIENCGLEFDAGAQEVAENIITQSAHTYSGGVCTVCGQTNSDYVTVGSVELYDGYYTTNGTSIATTTPTDNYAYYDASTDTLYLKNFTYTTAGTVAYGATIQPNSGNLTISLSGDNTIGGETYGIHSNVGSITLVSTDAENMGSLTINTNTSLASISRGIYCTSNITIDGVSVTISAIAQSVYSTSCVYIRNGTVLSANNCLGANYDIYLEDSKVTVTKEYDDSNGLGGKYIYITSSEVVVSGTKAIDCDESLYITESDVTLIGKIAVDEEAIVIPANNSLWQVDYGTSETSYKSSVIDDETNYYDDWEDYTYIRVAEHEHSYTSGVMTAATCTEKGVMVHACICGDSYTTEIAATGHSYESVVTEPTCTEKGYTTYTCSVCGDTYTDSETEPTGHTYDYTNIAWNWVNNSTVTATVTCSCGETWTKDATVTSRNVLGVVTRTATVEFDGVSYSSDPVTSGTSLLIIGALTQTGSEEVVSEETDSEVVEITEPVEDTNTESEPEEEVETPADENPATGAVIALLPIAIAIAGMISKKRLG
ncbi:MAG: leucine-rich repeat domain-containing protein [Oscillospiraceae bacterium]|nr:leucine-rich repeat domain-containing protein [Oscillospiraceae bacterium]